jgi:hypothetical protein
VDHDVRTADTGMLGSDAENPGPARDTSRTDPDPAATTGAGHAVTITAMSDADPDRTRLGTRERGNAWQ